MPKRSGTPGFGLYLHWPFCQAKCPYCDFNSHVAATIDQSRWTSAYLSEIRRAGQETPGRVLHSVFFGGGTPSLMSPDLVDAIMTQIRATWPTANTMEVTLEANPTSVEAGRFGGYRDAGVNRISLGVQALNDRDLKALGRLHSSADAINAYKIARRAFDSVSFDLIYARQNQTVLDWQLELGRALDMAVDHLSLYQLTIEEGTAFGARHTIGKLSGLPSEDAAADMFEITQETCERRGFPSYETSNHARPGAESVHNRIYWECGDYIGIGPGAHGRLTLSGQRYATETKREPAAWLTSVEIGGSGECLRDAIAPEDQLSELLIMGLRLRDGISRARLEPYISEDLSSHINGLEKDGWLILDDVSLRVSGKGRSLLNTIIRSLLGA